MTLTRIPPGVLVFLLRYIDNSQKPRTGTVFYDIMNANENEGGFYMNKKKLISSLVLGAMLATAPASAFAGTFTVDLGNPVAVMDGKKVVMESAAGVSKNGMILVPVRDVAEAYGGTVVYDKASNTVKMTFPNGHWATIEIDAATGEDGLANGDGIMSVGTFVNDRLYIPAQLMAVCLGARMEQIDWNSDHVYRLIYHVR